MPNIRKVIFGGLAFLAIALVLVFVLELAGLEMFKYFAPKYAEAEREVWEQTPSRIRGATQEITQRMREYRETNSTAEKNAICQYLTTEYPNLDPQDIDDRKVRNFYKKCKYGG